MGDKMEKKNWFEEKPIYNNDINKYFDSKLPINFNKIQNDFNIKISSCNFDIMKVDKKFQEINKVENIAGMIFIKDGIINLYYSKSYETEEKRFIIANLISYCMNMDEIKEKAVIIDYDLMLKCDEAFDGMNKEELQECINNKMARQILMPEDQFKLRYLMLLQSSCSEEVIVTGLAALFRVPEREVIIRCKELEIDLELENELDNEINLETNCGIMKKIGSKIKR